MRRYGLIGYPLKHSFSEKYFSEKFKLENILDATYQLYPIEQASEITGLVETIPNLCGLNVTIPHKENVMCFLDEIDEEAREVGAVNCIHFRNGKAKGYNTDVYGFRMSIKPFLENKFERALVLGTGGASKAVTYVLRSWNIPYYLVSRTKSTGHIFSWDEVNEEVLRHFKLIINTTPLGMFPNVSEMPDLPYDALGADHFLYDLVYNPIETRFLAEGKSRGASVMNGMKMLEWQAIRSWEIWNS
ncbi:MAG: shikimate dehydrogenase [Flavobacteriales bacterium]|nr:shikimate dehydrogenase [Flavobacteriales bacterium]